jgi:membrane protease YdiL (CAAX protease family)
MPAFLKIPAYLLFALAAGAAVAPPIYWAGQALAAAGVSDWLAGFPFHRVLSRCMQVSLIVLLWPALRWVGLRRVSELNLRRNPVAVSDVVGGFTAALVLIVLLAGIYLLSGWFALRPEPDWSRLGRIVLTALVVSCVEEAVFRGVILGVCLWSLSRRGAIFVSTVFFVVVHFIKPAKAALAPADVIWSSGFTEALNFTRGLPEFWLLVSGAASLFVAGWILGSAALATRSLWLPIGLHAGWVFGQQTTGLLLAPVGGDASLFLPWVGPNLVSGAVPTGLLPLVVLLATGALVHLYLRYVFRPVVSAVA